MLAKRTVNLSPHVFSNSCVNAEEFPQFLNFTIFIETLINADQKADVKRLLEVVVGFPLKRMVMPRKIISINEVNTIGEYLRTGRTGIDNCD